jgi:hypothetical protein
LVYASGSRVQTGKDNHGYSKLSIPVTAGLSFWPAVYNPRLGSPVNYRRLALKHTFKYNRILNDDPGLGNRSEYFYNTNIPQMLS